MPEGPEVRTIVDVLNEEVTPYTLDSITYTTASRYNKRELLHYDELHSRLPLTILGVESKGKKIIFRLDKGVSLVSSLMMEGKWSWKVGKHSDLWLNVFRRNKRIRINKRLYFDDSRHFGSLEILLTPQELDERLSRIGPDLLMDNITLDEWRAKVRYSRIKRKKVGLFLMEQKYFSGIGNYLRAEILYAARISPHRTLESLSEEEIETLLYYSRKIIYDSYSSRGFTLSSYWDPHNRKGEYKVIIYGFNRDPEGNPIIAEKFDDKRTIHWVPNVQV